jgi:hypothetical protein
MPNTFSTARSRRALRRLLTACQRDLAFYRYCGGRVADNELSATIRDAVLVREHLATALSHSLEPSLRNGVTRAERLGALHGWETALRARLARNSELAYVEELEKVENKLLEQVEDATLDARLNIGTRITLERHLALVHSSHERTVVAANRIRSRRQSHRTGGPHRRADPRRHPHQPEHETDASLTRAMSTFFYR